MTTEPGFESAHQAQASSEEAITRAFAAARHEHWRDAAQQFIRAALAVVVPTGSPSWEIARRNRERLYRNAAFCFEKASAAQEAREVFQRLLEVDAQNESTLRAQLTRFP